MTRTVLIVEDDEILRMLATEAREMLGVSVIACEYAAQALSVLETYPKSISLVFTDINMPGAMDGLALTTEILAKWQGIPVIVTSGKMGGLPRISGPVFEQARSAVKQRVWTCVEMSFYCTTTG